MRYLERVQELDSFINFIRFYTCYQFIKTRFSKVDIYTNSRALASIGLTALYESIVGVTNYRGDPNRLLYFIYNYIDFSFIIDLNLSDSIEFNRVFDFNISCYENQETNYKEKYKI